MKVAAFTCFNPMTGGGAVIVRRLIENMPDVSFTWFHLSGGTSEWPGSIYLGERLTGGPVLWDLWRSIRLWRLSGITEIKKWARQIAGIHADIHWIIAMDEGFPLANELLRIAPNVRLHLSVHDDQNYGLYFRSTRYCMLPLVSVPVVAKTLRSANSVDVISEGMAAFYRRRLGIRAVVSRHFIPIMPVVPPFIHGNTIRLGHIGNVYSFSQFRDFLICTAAQVKGSGKEFEVILIGARDQFVAKLRSSAGVSIVSPGNMPEAKAIQMLAGCDFLYAMYPFDLRSDVFRRTSLPTKVSTYIQAQRPIFAHTPIKSTLAKTVRRFCLGVVDSSPRGDGLVASIEAILRFKVPVGAYARARDHYYGIENVEAVRRCF